MQAKFPLFEAKMRSAGLNRAAVRAFQNNYERLVAGDTGLIPETSITPVTELPRFEEATKSQAPDSCLLAQTVVVKLNGGLGTSMGLAGPKSLLEVKDGLTFLDLIIRQLLDVRERYKKQPAFLLMNSFSTSRETLAFLKKYPEFGDPSACELMQNQVPKVDAETLGPVSWPANRQLEWCPPGHGDIYPALLGSGWLERLLQRGAKFLFVSNSDNLGATLDLGLLTYFATSGKSFLMEVAERTASDRKGGHLAAKDGKLLLRESAQCPESDTAAFQDITRHRFFNTNNLWLRLDALNTLLKAHDGLVPLPLIKNKKTVDPREKASRPVFQLETAMGAAIETFSDSGALVVPRSRFAPVKTTSDLMLLRSDAYVRADGCVLPTNPGLCLPVLDLDSQHYGNVEQLNRALADGVPSLKECRELVVRGPLLFSSRNAFKGKVAITNPSAEPRPVPAGEYQDCSLNI